MVLVVEVGMRYILLSLLPLTCHAYDLADLPNPQVGFGFWR